MPLQGLRMCSYIIKSSLARAFEGAWLLQGEALLRDLLAIHVVAHLNEALCQNYRKICPASPTLTKQCNQVMIASSLAGTARVTTPVLPLSHCYFLDLHAILSGACAPAILGSLDCR